MTRYAVAYKRFPDDPSVFYNGNAVCLFQQDEGTVEHFREYLLVVIPVKKDAWDTYRALERAISKKIGEPCELVFTDYQPTIWRVK